MDKRPNQPKVTTPGCSTKSDDASVKISAVDSQLADSTHAVVTAEATFLVTVRAFYGWRRRFWLTLVAILAYLGLAMLGTDLVDRVVLATVGQQQRCAVSDTRSDTSYSVTAGVEYRDERWTVACQDGPHQFTTSPAGADSPVVVSPVDGRVVMVSAPGFPVEVRRLADLDDRAAWIYDAMPLGVLIGIFVVAAMLPARDSWDLAVEI
jgi:hypothetical protein